MLRVPYDCAVRTRRQTLGVPNPQGHKPTLKPAHPGNTNAVKSGVHSERLIASRAAEIEGSLTANYALTAVQLVWVREIARLMAVAEAIDSDFEERGILRRGGKPSYLLEHRVRVSRQLERWLEKLEPVVARQEAEAELESRRQEVQPETSVKERMTRMAEVLAAGLESGMLKEHPDILDRLAVELRKLGWVSPEDRPVGAIATTLPPAPAAEREEAVMIDSAAGGSPATSGQDAEVGATSADPQAEVGVQLPPGTTLARVPSGRRRS
jgi:hypothetical protein